MIDVYDFFERCKEDGLSSQEAADEYSRAVAEDRDRFYEDYYSDPIVMEGACQQDLIDMYRRER